MPFAEVGRARLYYEDHGAGFPVLLIAPGGMLSALERWRTAPFDPVELLSGSFRVIAMDQRNAGRSEAPIRAGDGWAGYTADQLGLMDHLGIERFHVLGMCIGGPFALGLIEAAPERVASAVLVQPIGEEGNRDAFFELFDRWRAGLEPRRPEVRESDWASLRHAMFGGDFLFNVTRDFVSGVATPLLVLMGNDLYHPSTVSRAVAELARDARLIERWKEADVVGEASRRVSAFLKEHTLSDGDGG